MTSKHLRSSRLFRSQSLTPLALLAVLAAAQAAEPQPPAKVFRIGVLGGTSPEVSAVLKAFFERLRELGYVEGQNALIEGRYYGDRVDRLPDLAAELVRVPVDVIVTGAVPAPEAARKATSAIPIVMAGLHPDPVRSGLVASLARPGGNVTGLAGVGLEFRGKQLQLLKEALPYLRRHRRRTMVIKLGGEIADNDVALRSLAQDISLLSHVNIRCVVVHGGGPQATELSKKLGLIPKMVEGRRVTDALPPDTEPNNTTERSANLAAPVVLSVP